MAEFTFDFCDNSRVVSVIAPEELTVRDFNGWDYTPQPVLPYRRKFKVTLYGLTWYLNGAGTALDVATNPGRNAGRLEEFYTTHRLFKEFDFTHEYLGSMEMRFQNIVSIPEAVVNSGGRLDKFEVMMVEHNPSYT